MILYILLLVILFMYGAFLGLNCKKEGIPILITSILFAYLIHHVHIH